MLRSGAGPGGEIAEAGNGRESREEQGPVCREAGPGVRGGPAPGDAGGTIGRCASGPAGRAPEDGDGECSL